MHKSRSTFLQLLPLLMFACTNGGTYISDLDGDGLADHLELAIGTDPVNPDSDGDGLLDGEEYALGSDPRNIDSDGDTYQDGHEVLEGRSPTSPESRIYVGYWPYNTDKDAILEPEPGTALVGDTIARHIGTDQYNDSVDLYDFAAPEAAKLLILTVIRTDEPVGKSAATWIATGEDLMGLEGPYGAVRTAIDDGEVRYIALLFENADREAPTLADAVFWDRDFHHPNVPVLTAGGEGIARDLIYYTSFYPSSYLVKAKTMEVLAMGGLPDALEGALDRL